MAWPMQYGTATRIIAFVTGATVDLAEAVDILKRRLPSYMVPARLHELPGLPASANGKIDRKALARMLDNNLIP